jgi:hypothetical protein
MMRCKQLRLLSKTDWSSLALRRAYLEQGVVEPTCLSSLRPRVNKYGALESAKWASAFFPVLTPNQQHHHEFTICENGLIHDLQICTPANFNFDVRSESGENDVDTRMRSMNCIPMIPSPDYAHPFGSGSSEQAELQLLKKV